MEPKKDHPIVYFCAEYGFDVNLPIYAGGLGVLAGDTIKQAADENMPFVGVGLLYRGYGATQVISETGMQSEENFLYDPASSGLEHVYKDDMPLFIKVHLTEVEVWVRVWKKTFSENVVLYLLDTETDQNLPNERSITSTLYSGTQEYMLKQQLILGIGGVKLLETLGIDPCAYHLNEGRPNFLHWQVVRTLMNTHNISYQEAKEIAKSKTVYTNHTLVAAGNQEYSMDLLKVYSKYYAEKIGISDEELLKDGIANNPTMFSVTIAALNTSTKANGVSEVHTNLSKNIWPEYNWVNITNGIHFPTWQSAEIRDAAHDKYFLWEKHQQHKRELEAFIKQKTGYGYNPDYLIVSWARRLAGYKRLEILFKDIERIRAILKHSNRRIQLLVSGKVHQGNTQGKQMLQEAIGYMKRELAGHALFIPNYNLEIARMLTRGSDVWLNTPEFGMEASGTSGMKAASNGVLNLTIAGGWAAEVDWNGAGWVLDHKDMPNDLYHQLEHNVAPVFYTRNSDNVPLRWIEMMQKSIEISGHFSTARMLQEYRDKLYDLEHNCGGNS